ncbi:MAG: hypothetical protein ONA90_03755, partial [candidate division KSB1 bacterium]|nr:hypothetical protein [candidate division KSB1 bacterium]
FQGGQDPLFNHGKQMTSVTLFGATTTFDEGNRVINGDAIILLKSPQIVVADIIIDNVDAGTSPSSSPVELQGGWFQDCEDGGGYYTLRCAEWFDFFGFASAPRGNGEMQAVFRPNIGVTGFYEIFEWHGYLGQSPSDAREATNVPCTIKYAGGEKTMTIDQSKNFGRWNSLGTYYFTTGRNNTVTITNKADGPVLADALKFVFRGNDPNRDTTAPQPPQGVRVENP